MMHMQDQSNSSLPYSFQQGLGQARPNKKLSQRGKNFQELKICGHGTVLALHRCAQNAFPKVVSELLRRKNKQRVPLLVYVDRRLLRTKFLPLFCSGVGRKAGITLGRLMKFSRYGFPKKKIPPTQYRRRILSGETDGKMIGCVAGR